VPGEIYQASNNRGELTAIYEALKYIASSGFTNVVIVSDSEYSIKSIDVWVAKWLQDPVKNKLQEKKNLDLIVPAHELLKKIRANSDLQFRHINSHTREPSDRDSAEWFLWKGNDTVDKLCSAALRG
jgi:ribonuclease HI